MERRTIPLLRMAALFLALILQPSLAAFEITGYAGGSWLVSGLAYPAGSNYKINNGFHFDGMISAAIDLMQSSRTNGGIGLQLDVGMGHDLVLLDRCFGVFTLNTSIVSIALGPTVGLFDILTMGTVSPGLQAGISFSPGTIVSGTVTVNFTNTPVTSHSDAINTFALDTDLNFAVSPGMILQVHARVKELEEVWTAMPFITNMQKYTVGMEFFDKIWPVRFSFQAGYQRLYYKFAQRALVDYDMHSIYAAAHLDWDLKGPLLLSFAIEATPFSWLELSKAITGARKGTPGLYRIQAGLELAL
jgi:hypothetical protein